MQLFFFNSASHTAVNESLISWTEMSDTSRILYLLPRLAELHLQRCLSSGLVVDLIEMSGLFWGWEGGRDGWKDEQGLCCAPSQPGLSSPAGSEGQGVDELWLNKLSLSHGCSCQAPTLTQPRCSVLLHPSGRWTEGQGGEAQPLREASKLLPLAASRS